MDLKKKGVRSVIRNNCIEMTSLLGKGRRVVRWVMLWVTLRRPTQTQFSQNG